MKETKWFSCHECVHAKRALHPNWTRCDHPAVKAAEFEGHGIETYTGDDLNRLDKLVNDDLHIQLVTQGTRRDVPNFDFPFEFECVWISSCAGYERIVNHKLENQIWFSGPNK